MSDALDRVDRQIDIDADADRVWDLVSRPGWYVNTDRIVLNPVLRREGDVDVLSHPEYGEFRFRTVRLDRPRYAAFRWLGEPTEDVPEPSTLVEFWIDERAGGGVTLRVAESGFASLGKDEAAWLTQRDENADGWTKELAAARSLLDPTTVERSVDVAAPPERVWPLLSTGDGLARWYAFGGATIDASPGGALTLSWVEHGTFRGRVVEVDEPRVFGFRLAMVPDTEPDDGAATTVTLTAAAAGDGSVVTVRHGGFDQVDPGVGPAVTVAAEVEGWEAGLRRLAEVVRTMAGV